jgi:hypoxanthine phosphoribosyltransferase
MGKQFLPYDVVRNDALKLAASIYREGFVPDVIYIPLRGGAYMGNVISEFFKLVVDGSKPVFYAAVVARSYTDVHKSDKIMIDGWTYDPQHLRKGDKILFVDDIFDSGKTLNYLVDVILQRGIPRNDIKVAVHDYKDVRYGERKNNHLDVQPDYWCRKYVIEKPEENLWIHYMSHELVGLTNDELEEHYYKADPDLRDVFKLVK